MWNVWVEKIILQDTFAPNISRIQIKKLRLLAGIDERLGPINKREEKA